MSSKLNLPRVPLPRQRGGAHRVNREISEAADIAERLNDLDDDDDADQQFPPQQLPLLLTRGDAITELKRAAWGRSRRDTDAAEQVLREQVEQLKALNAELCSSHNALLADGARWQTRAEQAEALWNESNLIAELLELRAFKSRHMERQAQASQLE